MSESEIRRVLREVCEELDRGTRRVRRVMLPAALGAGVALSSGCGRRPAAVAEDGGAPDSERAQQSDRRTTVDARAEAGRLPPLPTLDVFRAPSRDAGPPNWEASVSPPQLDYMAPMYAVPMEPKPDAR